MAEEQKPDPDDTPLSIRELPATFIDTWWFTTWPGNIRITFGEGFYPRQMHYRMAIVMPLDDAEEFYKALGNAIEFEKKRKKEEEKGR